MKLNVSQAQDTQACRSPYGERGLKYHFRTRGSAEHDSRSPYGERGLKFGLLRGIFPILESLSLRRAWIEIGMDVSVDIDNATSLSLRRAWIEISNL